MNDIQSQMIHDILLEMHQQQKTRQFLCDFADRMEGEHSPMQVITEFNELCKKVDVCEAQTDINSIVRAGLHKDL